MKEKLYACVRVHGSEAPTAKAYACENEMEYWAEPSTAFLGGIGPDYDEEYNKWFPFNRQQPGTRSISLFSFCYRDFGK
jgi:hypothetical protein